jgi:GDP-L-fucose synthase
MSRLGEGTLEIRGRNVIVTGSAGFLGSHVWRAIDARHPKFVTASGCNLLNYPVTLSVFETLRPDIVVHLAAQVGGITANTRSPAEFIRNNLVMGLNVLDACVATQVKKLVVVGTACSYPKFAISPLREEDLWRGYPAEETAPYGIAKRTLLTAMGAYRQQYGLNSVMPILGNLYGPGDHYEEGRSHVVAAVVRRALRHVTGPLEIGGSPDTVRDFLFAPDAAKGIVEVIERYDDPEPINLSSGKPTTIGELVRLLLRGLGREDTPVTWDASFPIGHPARWLSIERARTLLGWTAPTDLEYGLRETVADYCGRFVLNNY